MSDFDRLDDYVRGAMPEEEAVAFEEALFTRAAAGSAPEVVWYDALVAAVRAMVTRGTFELYVTAEAVARFRASGLRVQYLEIENTKADTRYRIDRDCEILIARFPIDLRGVRSLDVEVWAGDRLSKVMKDVSFDEADGAIFFCCEGALARKAAGFRSTAKMWANESTGRRLLAEITTTGEIV